MNGDPPIEDWQEAEALREILRIARGLETEDFDRDVAPRLRRLSAAQRAKVAEVIDETLRQRWPKETG